MFGTASTSSNKPIKYAIFLILACGLAACGQSGNGDCYYDKTDTKAEITEIIEDPSNPGKMLVKMDFKASKLALETQELGNLKGIEIDSAYVARNHLKAGNQYDATVSEITKGNCTPRFVSFHHNLE